MHLRIVPGRVMDFRTLYRREIVPLLKQQEGNINSFLIELTERGNEFLSISIWNDRSDSQKYLSGDQYRIVSEKLREVACVPPSGREYAIRLNQVL